MKGKRICLFLHGSGMWNDIIGIKLFTFSSTVSSLVKVTVNVRCMLLFIVSRQLLLVRLK